MILSVKTLPQIAKAQGLEIPDAQLLHLPEKVLQFGTGVLLRGLHDYFIDKANKKGIFNGRVVVVKSTSQGSADAFTVQNNLYTQWVRGIAAGIQVNDAIINAAISRVINAADSWKEVLACASNPQMQIIISNTTEVGISLMDNEDVYAHPPKSFPGKLLAFLLERYNVFGGSMESGMVIIPAELLPDNATQLKSILNELARLQQLDARFIEWLNTANDFCNALVDRIVPGKLPVAEAEAAEKQLGYKDDLMFMSEVYRLWAIETSLERTKEILSFSKADNALVMSSDIEKFRELKLRLLNGSHTLSCGIGLLMGFSTVKLAMADNIFESYIRGLMELEIGPAICSQKISKQEANTYSQSVLERFKNPFLEHQWLSITLQYSSKMKMRNIPILLKHYERTQQPPIYISLGFAAYILFMKSVLNDKQQYMGSLAGKVYVINDDKAVLLNELWQKGTVAEVVQHILQEKELWGTDLSLLPGFANSVTAALKDIEENGIANSILLIINKI